MKLYPEIVFSAQKHSLNLAGFNFVILAKGQVLGGGTIPVSALKKYFSGLGVSESTFNRRLKAAIDLGLVSVIMGKRDTYYKLASLAEIASIAGVDHLDNPVNVDDKRFVSKGWIAYTWSAHLASSVENIPDVTRAPGGRTSKVNAVLKRMTNV
jgi:hypothetical protein